MNQCHLLDLFTVFQGPPAQLVIATSSTLVQYQQLQPRVEMPAAYSA